MKASLYIGPAETSYSNWPCPDVIVSDGPYGIDGYRGDLKSPDKLAAWYEPHALAWAKKSSWATTLWFFCTEIGWAETHPVIQKAGWRYVQCNVWDKGRAHVAGRVNTGSCRRYPVTTEVCVQYSLGEDFVAGSMQRWLRSEWFRSGLTLDQANKACLVKDAASRKYLCSGRGWYCPEDKITLLAAYANRHGKKDGRPYFQGANHRLPNDEEKSRRLRYHFRAVFGYTNVWQIPANRSRDRLRGQDGSFAHPNQKPNKLMDLIVQSSCPEGGVVWEPFGGTCSASLAAVRHGCSSFAAEINPQVATIAQSLLAHQYPHAKTA